MNVLGLSVMNFNQRVRYRKDKLIANNINLKNFLVFSDTTFNIVGSNPYV